jgi:hypothetical protein
MATPAGALRRILGILLIVAGALGFILVLVTSLLKSFGGLERVDVPGSRELRLEPGSYTIYWESDSRFSRLPDRSDLELAVVSKDGASRPPVASSGPVTSRYSTIDRVGVSVAGFTVDRAGDYAVTAASAGGKPLPKGGLALSRSLGPLGVLRIVALCLAVLAAGLGPGLYLLITSLKRR